MFMLPVSRGGCNYSETTPHLSTHYKLLEQHLVKASRWHLLETLHPRNRVTVHTHWFVRVLNTRCFQRLLPLPSFPIHFNNQVIF